MNKVIITEEMVFRQRLCEYAKKKGVIKAARKYQTNRMFVYRQLKKWDGTVKSLSLRSRRPNTSPNKHTEEELHLISIMYLEHGLYGNAELYVRLKECGYNRSFGSMCKQIRAKGLKAVKRKKKSYTKYNNITGQYIGDKVQIDIKYVPQECIMFPSYGKKYYQITAIDEYSRKRILEIVEEKNTFETGKFLEQLESKFDFPIHTIQVDNGYEFVNDKEVTNRKTYFEEVAEKKGYIIKRIRPYSPWQNGKVERSHREDEKILYANNKFYTKNELINAVKIHQDRYNNTAKICLNFKSPCEVAEENKLLLDL